MCEPFLGEIRMVGFSYAPTGWAFCEGQVLTVSQNSALFLLLGNTFGGDGVTTFALPDLRGRSPVGMGTGIGLTAVAQGETGGSESAVISTSQMPEHSHSAALTVAGTPSNAVATPDATNNILGASVGAGPPSAAIWSDALNDPVELGNPIDVGNSGGTDPLPLRNPYMGTNFIIALHGIFPLQA